MTFRELAEVFERIDAVSGRNAMIEILAELYQRVTPEEAAQVTYLMQGRLVPKFVDLEFGMASRLLLRSIAQAFEAEPDEVQAVYREAGDLGLAAEALDSNRVDYRRTAAFRKGWGSATAGSKPRRLCESTTATSARAESTGTPPVGNPSWRAHRQRELAQDWTRNVSVGGVFARLREVRRGGGRRITGTKGRRRRRPACATWTPRSNRYLPRIPVGRLRLGIGDPTFMDALSFARVGDKSERKAVERAYNLTCDLGQTARDYLSEVAPTPWPAPGSASAIPSAWPRPPACPAARRSSTRSARPRSSPSWTASASRSIATATTSAYTAVTSKTCPGCFPDVSQAARARLKKPRVIIEGEAMGVNPETGEFLPFQVTTSPPPPPRHRGGS